MVESGGERPITQTDQGEASCSRRREVMSFMRQQTLSRSRWLHREPTVALLVNAATPADGQ